MQNPRATTSLKPAGRDVNIAKYLSQMNNGHHCRNWKSPILGVAQIVLRDVFLASIFLAYVDTGKFSSAAPILGLGLLPRCRLTSLKIHFQAGKGQAYSNVTSLQLLVK